MQNVPQIFSFDNKQFRTIEIDGELWFVARDVSEILGYKNPQEAVRTHCKSAKPVGVRESLTPLDPQTTIIPERDVYRLVMRSKLPSAEKFEELVVGEVLPSIRKTGSYGTPQIDLNDPVQVIALLQIHAQRSIELTHMVEQRDTMITVMAPKAAIADRIATADGLHGFREVAKILQLNERKFKNWLVVNSWIQVGSKRMMGLSPKIRAGYIEHKEKLVNGKDGEEKSVIEMFFTAKGLHRLTALLNAEPTLDFSYATKKPRKTSNTLPGVTA
jgi:anti-repressor protein